MLTRALGKALGGRRRCPWQRPRPLAQWIVVLVIPMLSVPAAAEPDPGARPMPAFHQMEATALKKQRFFDYLAPVVRAENERIRRHRKQLLAISGRVESGRALRRLQQSYLVWLARAYGVDAATSTPDRLIEPLLARVDVIPRSLVLAQAAKESGWGCSRFARRGNNLFGQWCFEPGCGIVPRERPDGRRYEVRAYDTVRDSVASYMRNLNSHAGYEAFRSLRAELRADGQPLSGLRLADGLTAYSATGDAYVREVKTLIRQNGLETRPLSVALTGR